MEGGTLLGRLNWQIGEVVATQPETARTRSITLALPGWMGHRAGQHVDVRLTAEDGYQAERSYSIASPPEEAPRVTLTVERIDDGEVSPYLTEELRIGDQLELRGPIGGYFVWEEQMGGPLLLVAGGSGIVPLMAMLRHRAAAGSTMATRLLYSSRSLEDVIYRDELDHLMKSSTMLEVVQTLTRAQPPGWTGYGRRIDPQMLREVAWPVDQGPLTFICGPTPFVETAAASLVELGHEPERIKTERFGPTGEA
jgi:ferredoxin-NADP reductase